MSLIYQTTPRRFHMSILLAAAVLFGSPSYAQIATNGTLNGTISDSSGALFPGASIRATNESTGVALSTTSNEDGTFILPGLRVGQYRLRVAKPGFQTFVETGIVLHPATITTVNARLKVGQALSRVTVAASVNQVQTTTGEISSEITARQVSNLPLNGQNFLSLEALVPGTGRRFSCATGQTSGEYSLRPNAISDVGQITHLTAFFA